MDDDDKQAQLQQEREWFIGFLKTSQAALDIRKVTGWDDGKAHKELILWSFNNITVEEGIKSLILGEMPTSSGSSF